MNGIPGYIDPKDPLETVVVTLGVASMLDQGETPVSAEWVTICETFAEDTTDMVEGSLDTSESPIYRQKIKGGTHGRTYLHRVVVATSTGRKISHGVLQKVVRGASPA